MVDGEEIHVPELALVKGLGDLVVYAGADVQFMDYTSSVGVFLTALKRSGWAESLCAVLSRGTGILTAYCPLARSVLK